MSFPKPPVVASSVALLAALSVIPAQGWARDGRRAPPDDFIQELTPLSAEAREDVIFEMAPLRPIKGAMAPAPKAAPQSAAKPAPTMTATPAPAAPPPVAAQTPAPQPAPAQAAAEPPKPVESQPPAVAEAPKPAETQPVAEQQPAAPPPEAVAAQTPPVEAAAPVPEEAASQPPAAADAPVAGEAPAPVAQQPAPDKVTIVEPAHFEAPVMILNAPRKSVAALKPPVVAFEQNVVDIQGGAPAPKLVPALHSLARAQEPATAPIAVAEPQASAPQTGAEGQATPATQAEGGLTPEAAQAQQAAEDASAEARIASILAKGLAGPTEVRLGDRATLWLPAGRVFIPLEQARELAKEAGLEWRPNVQGIVAPAGGALEWLAPVEVLDDGFVKSGDAGSLAPEKLLAAFQTSIPEINAQRARANQPPVTLDGWLVPPALDDKHRLSACVNISTQTDPNSVDRFFNCESWALGRQGAIKVSLADGGEQAARLKGEAAALADAVVFDHGQTYEAFDAATDKVAPYVAADLLTRDVAARTPAPVATPAGAEAGAEPGLLSRLLYPGLFAVAALAALVLIKRRRAGEKGDEAAQKVDTQAAPAKSARKERVVEEKTAVVAGPAAAPSLFARLLPSLRARFAKKPAPGSVEAPRTSEDKEAPAKSSDAKPVSALGGLMGKLAALRGAKPEKAEPAPGPALTPLTVAPEGGADEPVSALKRLAAKMRKTNEEPPAPVNVSRVARPARGAGGAAAAAVVVAEAVAEPLIVETAAEADAVEELNLIEPTLVEPKPAQPVELRLAEPAASEVDPVIEAQAKTETPAISSIARASAPEPASVFDEDDFGLVEPGDTEAASAAINAARARFDSEE